ncbi:molybdopterin-guanine dinucleotide biosynthesis protein B [Chelatococcus sp. SYSU_G07232]|uniref:Molybdopterin-guanine dinucleotide biosynthesis protein B n=1 Tax=Chelatococcus albus TaxID=3047466 RepID=A0ABT7AKX5_9HYPH|nr:molybdopterin-guanine dinucleotide biosynthesis protein B [Chelatococcus sp. SYSU_G07232]MDJ1159622.1 molybdopterin-guanine dinucleotide biosynthesis protein B [Chelatococcus sp. SYSU_G07232]
MRVIGLAGWSGSGKTTLVTRLIPALAARGLKVSTIKHAHHGFDVDQPGKDSWQHRKAGACEVIVSSARRWVQMHELHGEAEPTLPDLLARLSPCDIVIVEGFKRAGHPKIEVFRRENAKPPLHPTDDRILAVASDTPFPGAGRPVVSLDDIAAIADMVLRYAEPIEAVARRLEVHGAAQ